MYCAYLTNCSKKCHDSESGKAIRGVISFAIVHLYV